MTSRLVSLAFVAALVLVYSASGFACSCAGSRPPCAEFWHVDAVFSGTVVGDGEINVGEGVLKREMRLVHLTVDQPMRGMQSAEVEVVTGWGGGDCGYRFRIGEHYLVYAYHDDKTKRLETSTCTRTRRLTEADEDLAFIRGLPASGANGLIYGNVGKRNYHWKEGDSWYLPVADAELTIEGKDSQYPARSDEKGNFRIENVLPGKYVVKLKLPAGLVRNSPKDEGAAIVENEIEVAAQGCAQTEFYLESDTRVRGRVLDAKGNPIAKLRVEIRGAASDNSNINTFGSAITDADGYFEFKIVAPGEYRLGYHITSWATQEDQPYARTYLPGVATKAMASIVSVKEGEVLAGLALHMPRRLSQRAINGFIVWSDGQPVAGASVYVELSEEGEMSSFSPIQPDAEGRFTLKLYEGLQYKVGAFWRSGEQAGAERVRRGTHEFR
jgi:5-hydroxyisourate hydrolase-like protein (transthyretin family)